MDFYLLIILFFLSLGIIWFWAKQNVEKTRNELLNSFKSHSLDVMDKNHRSFLELAKATLDKYQQSAKQDFEGRTKAVESMLKPVTDSMQKIEKHSRELEQKRIGAYASMQKQVDLLIQSEQKLRGETANLVKALKSPNIRGTWGQLHLRRVVELAGMLNHCDFFEQQHREHDGKSLRPDLIVKLPGERNIIVDAKTPLDAYLESIEITDDIKQTQKLKEYASHLRKHMRDLSSKEYWKQFHPTPEYVVLFLPAEAFFSAALQVEPSLIEEGVSQNVIVATPTTLIALLRSVAYGWNQEILSKSAKEIAGLGKELYERMLVMSGHFTKLGKTLTGSVDAYNQAISSFESRVLVSARKLKDSGAAIFGKDLETMQEIDKTTKTLRLQDTLTLEDSKNIKNSNKNSYSTAKTK